MRKTYRSIARIISESELQSGHGIAFTVETEDAKPTTLSLVVAWAHPNDMAKRFAFAKIAQLCAAFEMDDIDNTEDLHNKPFILSYRENANAPDNYDIVNIQPVFEVRTVISYIEREDTLLERLWKRFGL